MKPIFFFFLLMLPTSILVSQSTKLNEENREIYGLVIDSKTKLPLAFTNIGVISKNRGTVSNENGQYLLNISKLQLSDTVSFHYMGYKAKKIAISQLLKDSVVALVENIISISDFVVYGNEIDAEAIVEKVIPNKDNNYKLTPLISRMFIRERYATDIAKLRITPLKSTFDQLDKSTARMVENNIPKKQLSYTDYYGDVYSTDNEDIDKERRRALKPIKVISLKDISDYNEIEETFNNLFADTKKDEYWQVASGVFHTSLDVDDDSIASDTAYKVVDYKNTIGTWFFAKQINRSYNFLSMNSDENWEFLYKTSKYNYTLFGGTSIKGEDVYIIDFVPKRRGTYKGRLYISCSTYAILKAEFEYADGKLGTDFSLLGVLYEETIHKVTVFYENKNGNYRLKYLFRQEGEQIGLERKVELRKKRKRFLWDKTIAKYKVKIGYLAKNLNSIEILVINEDEISEQQFKAFTPKDRMTVKYVNQFDDNMWKGFSIIAPTDQMKDYRKH